MVVGVVAGVGVALLVLLEPSQSEGRESSVYTERWEVRKRENGVQRDVREGWCKEGGRGREGRRGSGRKE